MPTSARECPSCHTSLPDEAQFCFRCGHATPTEPGVPPRTMPTGEIEVAKVRQTLADRYRIERVVGEGGMATVYLAEDLKHRRPVAVKVMRPELAATLGGDRFVREVEIAAQLNHPHILPLLDSGDADGVLYYVMPFVEGESLAARIAREGELPVSTSLQIAREVAEALAYAHRRGIVHRDIKPANILLNEGHALVADFGIARAVDGDGTAITATGLAIGTPQYMSPEQATGGREVDGRTDVYALGAVLYEMLTGEPPFTGRTPQAVVARMMTERPRALATARDGVPRSVEQVVMRALARSPADRYATATELAEALVAAERTAAVSSGAGTGTGARAPESEATVPAVWPVLGGLALLALLAVAFLAGRWGLPSWVLGLAVVLGVVGLVALALTARAERARRTRSDGADGRGTLARLLTWRSTALGGVAAVLVWAAVAAVASARRPDAGATDASAEGIHVAVLPFQNQGDSADSYIVDGITDEVRGKLARVRQLAVSGSGSSAQYRGSTLAQTEIARQLGVDYLLLGRVRWAGSGDARRLQLVSELVDGSTGATRWQETFEAPVTDVFGVQSRVAARVAAALGAQLASGEAEALARPATVNQGAWDAFQRGQAISPANLPSMRAAMAQFEDAVALDADFAEAWGELAKAAGRVYANGAGRDQAIASRARAAKDRALALDSASASVHTAAAAFFALVEANPEAERHHLNRAMALAPNDVEVLVGVGNAARSHGRYAEAIPPLERARELDPRSTGVYHALAMAYLGAARFDAAVEAAENGVALAPDDVGIWQILSMVFAARGDLAGARGAAQRAVAAGLSAPSVAQTFAGFYEMTWALPPDLAALVPRLSPGAFDGDRAWWAQSLATHHWTTGRPDLARAYGDSGIATSYRHAQDAPEDPAVRTLHAVTLAYAGRGAEAVADAELALELDETPVGSHNNVYYRLQLVRVHLVLGQPEPALDQLEIIARNPGYVHSGWLRLDPLFASLRDHPRFRRLVD